MNRVNVCEKCRINKATVQISKHLDGQKNDIWLCGNCAKDYKDVEVIAGTQFSTENFMSSLLDSIHNTGLKVNYIKTTKCDKCGMNYGKFKEIGRLGCDQCYKTFEEKLNPLIQRLHGSTLHTGKVSKKVQGLMEIKRECAHLRNKMNEAVKQEAFEEALVIRDKLRALEEQVRNMGGHNE